MSYFDVIYNQSLKWIKDQEKHETDFYNKEGLLVCGVCGEKRQEYQSFKNPTIEDPQNVSVLKSIRKCRCEREMDEREKQAQREEKVKIQIQNKVKMSMMEEKYRVASFSNFKVNKYNEKNLKICKRYATAFDEMLKNNQGLIMWGGVGTGKSNAAACIANYILRKNISAVMITTANLLNIFDTNKENAENIGKRLETVKLLVLDDLGAERNTGYALEKVYNIIDKRYSNGLPIIVTTNLTMEEMKSETDIRYARIYDRLFETCYPMQFTGPSWRKVIANNRFEDMKKFLEGE